MCLRDCPAASRPVADAVDLEGRPRVQRRTDLLSKPRGDMRTQPPRPLRALLLQCFLPVLPDTSPFHCHIPPDLQLPAGLLGHPAPTLLQRISLCTPTRLGFLDTLCHTSVPVPRMLPPSLSVKYSSFKVCSQGHGWVKRRGGFYRLLGSWSQRSPLPPRASAEAAVLPSSPRSSRTMRCARRPTPMPHPTLFSPEPLLNHLT